MNHPRGFPYQADWPAPGFVPGRAHLIGIAGSGMRSLAEVLRYKGWIVTGSDLAADTTMAGVGSGHTPNHVPAHVDLVVASDAVPEDNCERRQARRRGVPLLSYAQALGWLVHANHGLAVAGTHGKSTTTAMAARILRTEGLDPTVVCGAEPVPSRCADHHASGRSDRSAAVASAELVLVEACEYRRNFLNLRPVVTVVLGIEPDHFDCFSSQQELVTAFAQFAQQTRIDGLVLAYQHCSATLCATSEARCRRETFGFGTNCDWRAVDLRQWRGRYQFGIERSGRPFCQVRLRVPGKHNVGNALAAAALAHAAGALAGSVRRGLAGFLGVRRRLEVKGTCGGVTLVDDYAHHPTEVAASLAAVREMAPGGRVWCVFQPHQQSRTENLLDGFASSLQNADTICIADIFCAREEPLALAAVSTANLVARARRLGGRVTALHGLGRIEQWLSSAIDRGELTRGDVVITMGAGDVGKVADALASGRRVDP